jgi:O-antigen/teichoic acid export membrane protein
MRFIQSSGATLIFKTMAMTCGFGASLLIARILGPQGRGLYGLIMTVLVLATVCGLFGFASANAYLISKDRSRTRAFGTISLIMGALGSALAVLVITGLSCAWPGALGDLHGRLLWATLALVPVFLWGNLFSCAYLGRGDIIDFNLFETGQRFVFALSAAVVLCALKASMTSYVMTVVIVLYLLLLIYVIRYYLTARPGRIFDMTLFKPAFSFGMRSYVATLVTYGVIRSGIFFVTYYRGTAEAGQFAVAQQLSELLVIIPGVIATILSPRIARGDAEHLTPRVMRIVAALLLPMFLAMLFAREFLIAGLFGSQFLPASDVLLILLPGAFLLGLETILAADMAGHGYPWAAALAWVPVLCLNAVGYLILIPRFGIKGAALSSSISFAAIFLLLLFYYKRMHKCRILPMFLIEYDDVRTMIFVVHEFIFRRTDTRVKANDAGEAAPLEGRAESQKVGSRP